MATAIPTQEQYERRVEGERKRLRRRLSNGQYFEVSKEISWQGVDELHAVLDRLGVSSKQEEVR